MTRPRRARVVVVACLGAIAALLMIASIILASRDGSLTWASFGTMLLALASTMALCLYVWITREQ